VTWATTRSEAEEEESEPSRVVEAVEEIGG